MAEWYGWPADAAEGGFKTLREHGLVSVYTRRKKAPLSPAGLTEVNHYYLLGSFAQARIKSPTGDFLARFSQTTDTPVDDTSKKDTP